MARPPIPLPERARLFDLFDYDRDTGDLIRRPRPRSEFKSDRDFNIWNTRWNGHPAGCPKDTGIAVEVDGIRYQAHRLIWKMVHGEPVPDIIDHRDVDNQNNRIDNLRAATDGQNTTNGHRRCDNVTGVKGVSYSKERWKYYAQLSVGGKTISLGRFDTLEEAAAARRKAAEEIYGEFARHV